MNKLLIPSIVLFGITAAVIAPSSAEDSSQKKELPLTSSNTTKKPQRGSTQAVIPVIYKPPLRGAPSVNRLVGGGTRGRNSGTPMLAVLAPEHTGLTTVKQPTLYWYISEPSGHPLEFTLVDEKSVKPLLETQLDSPKKAGIQVLRLGDFGINLTPGTEYQWSIALVLDPEIRSHDILTFGTIKRINLPSSLSKKLPNTDMESLPHLYGEYGLWYETVASLSELIKMHPENSALRQSRAALLDQVALPVVAEFERVATN